MKRFIAHLCALAAIVGAAPLEAAVAASQPNIILILSDDMGFSDLGCYGGEIRTPNLDALAKNGLRFTQFYNTARCCPTRASLLTGLHPHQAGMGHMTGGKVVGEGYTGNLNNRCVTIAEALKPAGYRAYMCGKWHITRHDGAAGPKDTWRLQRGFDKFYGTIKGGGSFYDPTSLCRGNTFITPQNDAEYKPAKFYYTDAISDNAVKFLREHQRDHSGQPFFFYVAYTAAHWPMHALPEDIARYRGKYDGGYAPIRAARFARAKELGLIKPDWPLSPQAGDWAEVTNKAWESRCMEVYAAMVDRMDQGIGRLVEELKRSGQFDNTLILFLQDNGGCAENMGRRSNAKQVAELVCKPFGPDDLQTNIWPPMQTRDGRPVRTGPEAMPGPEDTYVGYGEAWANVSNTPFREYKHWVHEGGISTPLIVHWPAAISRSRRNALVHEPGQLPDIMATCIEVAGAKYPAEYHGHKITPLAGQSLAPAFAGQAVAREGLFWEHEGNRAVRVGSWKLVAKGPRGPWELYDLAADRTEMNNLASRYPERVMDLAARWNAWAHRAEVLPWPWKGDGEAADSPVSAKLRFYLEPGANLPRAESPDYANRPFTVTVRLVAPSNEGVLVAQGGDVHGWGLFFQNGALHFAINRAGKLEDITSSDAALATAKTITAAISADATVTINADGREVLKKQAAGLPQTMPVDGLQVGRDLAGTVGEYAAPFAFKGQIQSVTIELGPRPGK